MQTPDEVRARNQRDDIEARTLKVIKEHLDGDGWTIDGEPQREHLLGRDLGADSLDLVEIVMSLEEEFNVEIPDDAIDGRFADKCVGDMLDVVEKALRDA